jgi:hypothetical protein
MRRLCAEGGREGLTRPKCDPRPTRPLVHVCTATRVNNGTSSTSAAQHVLESNLGNLDILRYTLESYTSIFCVLSFPLGC